MLDTATRPAPATWNVGDRVLVVRGENSNESVRENVEAVIIGCRGPIVVTNRTEPGRFHGEGVWALTSDLRPLDTYSPCACNCTPCRAGAHCNGSACERWT